MYNWFKVYWWIFILILIFLIATVAIFTPWHVYINQWAEILTKLLTPISILMGLVLGYPLIKKKLTEKHIIKQFEIMDNANRDVRNKVIKLLDEYKVECRSNSLTLEYINEALAKITNLKYTAIDAAPDVYRYTNLIYKTLFNLFKIYSRYQDADALPHHNYQENLSTWLHNQLNKIFDYSKTIGVIPSGEVIHKKKVNKFLSKYVTHNKVVEIKDVTPNIEYFHSEAMLVLFFGTSVNSLFADNIEIHKAAFEAAPSPCPFARLLLNNSIYFPLVLKSKEKLWIEYGELALIGYKKKKSTNTNSETKDYYECVYANISNISFVRSTINNLENLNKYIDGYINKEANLNCFYDFKNHGHEIISIKISHQDAQENFVKIKDTLLKTIKKEL